MKALLGRYLIRAGVRLLGRRSERVVFLNVEEKEGPPGYVLPFATWREEDWQTNGFKVISWPKDDPHLPKALGEPVPESVATAAGWQTEELGL